MVQWLSMIRVSWMLLLLIWSFYLMNRNQLHAAFLAVVLAAVQTISCTTDHVLASPDPLSVLIVVLWCRVTSFMKLCMEIACLPNAVIINEFTIGMNELANYCYTSLRFQTMRCYKLLKSFAVAHMTSLTRTQYERYSDL